MKLLYLFISAAFAVVSLIAVIQKDMDHATYLLVCSIAFREYSKERDQK